MATQDPAHVKEVFNSALKSLAEKNLTGAKMGFEKVIQLNPKSAEGFLNLGIVYFLENNVPSAIENLKKAVNIDPTLAKGYANLGNCCFKEGNYKDAIGYWNVATNINPDNPTVQRNIAVAYEKIGNNSKAFQHYELFLKFNRKNDRTAMIIKRKVNESKKIAYHNLNAGVTFQKRKQWADAALAYAKSIEIYPNFAKAHLNLGSIFYQGDKLDAAIESWERALKLDSSHPNTHCNLAIAYDRQKYYDEAFFHYKKYLETTQGRTKDAPQVKSRLDELQIVLNDKRELIRQHSNKGDEYYKSLMYEEAIYEYEKYLILNPSGADANATKKKLTDAQTRLNPIEKALEVALQMGDEYMRASLFDKAIAAYNRYLALAPQDPKAKDVKKRIDECHKHISSVVSAMLKGGP